MSSVFHCVAVGVFVLGVAWGGTGGVSAGRFGLGFRGLVFDSEEALAGAFGSDPATRSRRPDPSGRTDFFGDRLPPGAVARLGTIRQPAELPDAFRTVSSIRGVAFSPDGRLLATYGEPADPAADRAILLWDAQTGQQLHVLEGHRRPIKAIAFSPQGKYLASSSFEISGQSGLTRIWETATGRVAKDIPEGGSAIRFTSQGANVAVTVRDQVRIYNVGDGHEVGRFLGPNVPLAFSTDGRKLLALSHERDTLVRLFDITRGEQLLKLEGCQLKPPAALFSPDGRTVAAADGGSEILLWEVATGREVHRLSGHAGKVFSLSFSPDGRLLASGSVDQTIRLWEVATGKQVHQAQGHRGLVTAVAFDDAGHRVVSGSTDRTALVWDLGEIDRSTLAKRPPDEKRLETIWHDLAAANPAQAYRAIGEVSLNDEVVVAYLKRRIHSILVPEQSRRIEQLIRELDHEEYSVRQRATVELTKLRQIAKPVLLKVIKETQSAEVRYRIRRILTGSEDSPRFSAADVRRMQRTIHALEQAGGRDSEAILEMIIDQFTSEAVIRDARETLDRLRQRRAT